MGQDNQPKHRQAARDLRRKSATRKPIDRLLIVCEGEKTEPQYLNEIRADYRLPTAHVLILPSDFGTDPLSVVNYAEKLFLKGDPHRGIPPRGFDHVTAVFDRDEHASFGTALTKIRALDGMYLNNEKQRVVFGAVVTVPCFELWLLLHYREVHQPMHRDEILQHLRSYLNGYSKGQKQLWERTKSNLGLATQRAKTSRARTGPEGQGPYTNIDELVDKLQRLKGAT